MMLLFKRMRGETPDYRVVFAEFAVSMVLLVGEHLAARRRPRLRVPT